MALRLEDKQKLVAEVSEVAASAESAIAAEYRGLSVAQMTEFRSRARDEGVYVKVIKNTLAKRAVQGTDFECLSEVLRGPLMLAFSREDPGAAARVVKAFATENEQLVTKAVAVSGELYGAEDLGRLASLPNLDQARAMLLGVLSAPAGNLARTLAEGPAMFARVLGARGESGAEA